MTNEKLLHDNFGERGPAKLPPLLDEKDPAPFTVLNGDGDCPLLLICDHASKRVPARLGDLGVGPGELDRHIGWDIGAAGVTRTLSEKLDAPAVMCNYSRLVIDCNRQPGDPGSIPQVSDGTEIPANQNLGEAEQIQRTEAIFWPYHHAITDMAAHLWRKGTPPALFSVHSFTPELRSMDEDRPWHVAILWKKDPRIAVPILKGLAADSTLKVGDNEPYNGFEHAYSIDMHGAAPGLPYCAIEIRQDLIETEQDQVAWGERLARLFTDILQDTSLHRVEHY